MSNKLKTVLLLIGSISGIILIITGIIFICINLPGSGKMNIKSLILSGEINTDSIGLVLIFLGVILQIIVIKKSSFKTKKIVFTKKGRKEKCTIEEESGDPYVQMFDEVFPKEQLPSELKNIPIIDWLSKENIKMLVNDYVINDLLKLNLENYFDTKIEIFSKWNKQPICDPPIHNELEEWLVSIKNEWDKKLEKVK